MRFKIRNKCILGFAPLAIIIVISGALGIKTFFSLHQLIATLHQKIAPSAMTMLEYKNTLLSLEAGINAGQLDRKKTEARISTLQTLTRKHLPPEKHSDDPTQQTAHDLRRRVVRVVSSARSLLNLTEKGRQDTEETSAFFNSIHQQQLIFSGMLDVHISSLLEDLSQMRETVFDTYRLAVAIKWSVLCSVLLIIFFMVRYLTKTVISSIRPLHKDTGQTANGAPDEHVSLNTSDTLAECAQEFNANQELQRTQAQVHILTQELMKAQETERKKISLDLHDNVAQEISALKVMSETLFLADQAPDIKQLQENMGEWSNVLNRCIATVRDLSYSLRPPMLEHLGITTALADYCREYSMRSGIHVEYSSVGMDTLSPSLDYDSAINIYRVVQEALNNIKKHACAGKVKIKLGAFGPGIFLHIEDDGQGFDPDTVQEKVAGEKRLGLLGMRERIRMLNGTIDITSRSQEGTKISIEIPWGKPHVS